MNIQMNEPHGIGIVITKWLLLFLECDFKIVYKLSICHLMVDALN